MKVKQLIVSISSWLKPNALTLCFSFIAAGYGAGRYVTIIEYENKIKEERLKQMQREVEHMKELVEISVTKERLTSKVKSADSIYQE